MSVNPEARLIVVGDGVKKTVTGTDESKVTQRVAIFLGKEFARIGHSSTIYSTMGIRP
jgi:Family of unknown function (DUF6521)